MSTNLETLRHEMDKLSTELLEAMSRRAAKALEIAQEKKRQGMPMRDPYREAQILERMVSANRGPIDPATLRTLFRGILDASVAVMEQPKQRGLSIGAGQGPQVVIDVRGHKIGDGTPVYIAGPCSVESEAQIEEAASRLAGLGVGFLRAGAYKPRTSPYAFQGLGEDGLKLLRAVAVRHGLAIVTEATSPANVTTVAEYADVIQIGARNMYNYELLRAAGQTGKPVLLKRGFSATLEEWTNAAEYVALAGSDDIILCERGVRGFGRETRATLDLSIVPLAQKATRLPVVVDVSHAAGRRDILQPLTTAAFAVGADAVMLEVHPDPDIALSDAEQQITVETFAELRAEVARTFVNLASRLGAPTVLPSGVVLAQQPVSDSRRFQ